MQTDVQPFRAIAISARAYALQADGRSIIHMEFGQPSTGAPPSAIATAHRVLDRDPMGYWESPALRQRLARHYQDRYQVDLDANRFALTCGASPALVLALLTRFSKGARIALARPGYVAYRNTLRALDLVPIEIACGPSTRYQLTADLIAGLDPAPDGVIVASPANPTGTIIDERGLAAIAAVCRDRNIAIISDEIYHGLSYGPPTHSLLEFEPDAFVINSFSKYFSMAGWRLGWIVTPPGQTTKVRTLLGNLFLSAPSLSQHAALAAFEDRDVLEGHVEVYRRNRQHLINALPLMGISSIAPPDGAFYIYADVSHLTSDSFSFCKKVLEETGIALAPGVDFDPVDGHRFIRISFAVSEAETEAAIGRLRDWLLKQ
jgi:aspartate/methionine/tyrosine aminotransferase